MQFRVGELRHKLAVRGFCFLNRYLAVFDDNGRNLAQRSNLSGREKNGVFFMMDLIYFVILADGVLGSAPSDWKDVQEEDFWEI
jgi:hypothetical protein